MHLHPRVQRLAAVLAITAAPLILTACSAVLQASPEPTPMDFPSIAGEVAQRGIVIEEIASGDAGCKDPSLIPTAIGFNASGLGISSPIRLRVYIFRTGETYDRRRPAVEPCVAAWAADPATIEFINARPFVLAGQGPWPDAFKAALRAALVSAAGNGG